MRAFSLAYNARDLEALMTLYEPGAKIVAAWGERIEEIGRLREMFLKLLQFDGVMRAVQHLCIAQADCALSEGEWILRRGIDSEGRLFRASIRTYQVLRRSPTAGWRIALEHSASTKSGLEATWP
jgi:ketosteroid isomerase-like protein